jgi:predicted nucleic acid-binding protein
MLNAYLDSSAVLRWLLAQEGAWNGWGKWDRALTSALTRVEVRRSMDRMRLAAQLSDEEVSIALAAFQEASHHWDWIILSPEILESASNPFPTAVKTLDAIHLASARLWLQESVTTMTFVTHDKQQAIAAQALGFKVAGI